LSDVTSTSRSNLTSLSALSLVRLLMLQHLPRRLGCRCKVGPSDFIKRQAGYVSRGSQLDSLKARVWSIKVVRVTLAVVFQALGCITHPQLLQSPCSLELRIASVRDFADDLFS